MKSKVKYLDYNSTTSIDPRVLDAILPFLKYNFANSNSTHYFGQNINEKVKQTHEQMVDFINAEPNELIFTIGATAAINFVVKGIAESYSNKGNRIITISTEHKAVLDTYKNLERNGIQVTFLSILQSVIVVLAKFPKTYRPDNVSVSVMYVNNEAGVIQPIKEIAKLAHEKGALFMIDATQTVAVGKIEVDDLAIDLLCLNGHKVYIPNGIVALYIKNKTKLYPQIHRGGTLNVPSIIALAKACEIAIEEMYLNKRNISELNDQLETEFLKLPNTSLNGASENRIYNATNICVKEQDANLIISRMKNIPASDSSAYSSAVDEPSYALKSIGLNDNAFALLGFSLGKYNKFEYIETVVNKINTVTQINFNYA